MPRLKIDPKKSLYEPVEIEIGGKAYILKKIDRAALKKIRELDAETQKGNLDAAYQRLELLIGKHKFIDNLALENLIDITDFVIRSIISPTKKEKNAPGPGAKKSQ
jgi:hypothetical protein